MRVLSATENIDTFNENDDLIIGFKGLVNDFYARDGSRRVRTGYRQKQREGIVTIPPFGYFKDKNTKKVVVVEEAAETVRLMLRSRQAKLKRDINLIDDILREGKMSEAHLRMLVEKILVHEEDGRLDLEIRLKAPFRDHLDVFENGAQADCFPSADFDYDRLGAVIYGDYYAG